MSAEREFAPHVPSSSTRPRRALVFGLLSGFVLVAAFALHSAYDAYRARSEVHELVEEAEQVLVLAARIGRSLAEERNAVSEAALSTVPRRVAEARQRIEAIEARIEADLEALEPRLDERELAAWEAQRSRMSELRAEFAETLRDIELGNQDEALAHWSVGAERVDTVRADLEELAEPNEAEARELLARADQRLARMVVVQLAGGVLLLLAIGALFIAIQRLTANALGRIEQSNRDLDAFAGRIAHDVRNALSPIGLAGALLRSSPDRETALVVGQELERSTGRARRLLDGLLAFSRGEQHRRGRADVDRACQEVLQELAPAITRVGAEVEPEVARATVALAPELLHLVLANVVGNAVKFLDGRPQRRVRIRGRVTDAGYAIEVEDTGPGIPVEAIERVFEPFYRVPGTRIGGTGIGLATVRRIVDAHGGEVRARSSPGQGTTFRLRLPLDATATEPGRVASLVVGVAEPVERT